MNEQIQMQFSDMNFKAPVMATDGNMIMIDNNGPVTLLFFQMRGNTSSGPKADIVAAARLHNIEELKELHKTIGETIKQHQDKEE